MRIHLDRVDDLGSFIEFEGVAAPEDVDLARFEDLLADLPHSFGIEDADLLGGSYCDLVLAADGNQNDLPAIRQISPAMGAKTGTLVSDKGESRLLKAVVPGESLAQ